MQDMKTNKPKFKKTGLNIQISQTLKMNAAQDKDIEYVFII